MTARIINHNTSDTHVTDITFRTVLIPIVNCRNKMRYYDCYFDFQMHSEWGP